MEQVIAKYIEGLASEPELRELARVIIDDPSAADAFAEATRMDGMLTQIFRHDRTARTTRRRLADASAVLRGVIGAAEYSEYKLERDFPGERF